MNNCFDKINVAIPGLAFLLIILVIAILFVWSFIWMYKDAQLRGKSGCLVVLVLLFFVTWPLSIIIWLVCRPNIRNDLEYREKNRMGDNFREQ